MTSGQGMTTTSAQLRRSAARSRMTQCGPISSSNLDAVFEARFVSHGSDSLETRHEARPWLADLLQEPISVTHEERRGSRQRFRLSLDDHREIE